MTQEIILLMVSVVLISLLPFHQLLIYLLEQLHQIQLTYVKFDAVVEVRINVRIGVIIDVSINVRIIIKYTSIKHK